MKYIYILLLIFLLFFVNYKRSIIESLDNKKNDTEEDTQSCDKHFFNENVYVYDKNRNNSSKTIAINNV